MIPIHNSILLYFSKVSETNKHIICSRYVSYLNWISIFYGLICITLGLTEELLRNDPCHCGSGKKFKECHMKSQWPREYFEVPINPATPTGSTVVEYRNGKWEKIPGISLAMTVYVVDPQYVYNDVVDLLKPLSSMTFFTRTTTKT